MLIVRDHVLSGRSFSSIEEMDAAFTAWVPVRRTQIHKTHREVIAERAARDHAALKPLPPIPYLVAERQLRHVGKDCLVAFDGNLYSVPARRVRPRQLVEILANEVPGHAAFHPRRRPWQHAAGHPLCPAFPGMPDPRITPEDLRPYLRGWRPYEPKRR